MIFFLFLFPFWRGVGGVFIWGMVLGGFLMGGMGKGVGRVSQGPLKYGNLLES
jgi:hypothetical protein